MNQKRNIRFVFAFFFLHIVSLLVIPGCKENRWKNYSPEDRTEIEKGCLILTPLQFKAVVKDLEWQDYHGKRRPNWIHAEVIDFQECPELELSKAFEGKSWFDFSGWPKIRLTPSRSSASQTIVAPFIGTGVSGVLGSCPLVCPFA